MLRAVTPVAEAAAPLRLAHCAPSTWCNQRAVCARADRRLCDPHEHVVDGTALRHSSGNWCPIFVDVRGVALEAA